MAPFRRGGVHGGLTIGDLSGGQLTEPAIENGLDYFSHTQFNDGHWSLHALPEGIAADPASLGSLHADTAATGLALLTYLGAGYTHEDEKYRDVVRRGVEWLVKHQQPDGNLSYHGSEPDALLQSRHRHDGPLRGLWHDPGPRTPRAGPESDRFHRQVARSQSRRLAL